jgi:hypothetical protein
MMKTASSASLSNRLPLPPAPHHHLHDLHLLIKFFKFFAASPSFVDDDFFVFVFFFFPVLVASRAAPNPKFILESAQNPGVFSPLPRTHNRCLINNQSPPIFHNKYKRDFEAFSQRDRQKRSARESERKTERESEDRAREKLRGARIAFVSYRTRIMALRVLCDMFGLAWRHRSFGVNRHTYLALFTPPPFFPVIIRFFSPLLIISTAVLVVAMISLGPSSKSKTMMHHSV